MNTIKKFAALVSENRTPILKRTAIVAVGIVGVTLAAGLIAKAPAAAEAVAEVAAA